MPAKVTTEGGAFHRVMLVPMEKLELPPAEGDASGGSGRKELGWE